jgi:hypothetical protein
LDSFNVRNDVWEIALLRIIVVDVGKLGDQFDSLLLGLVSLDTDDLFDSFLDVELCDVLSELASFQLSVI